MIAKLRGLLARSVAARVVALFLLYLLGLPVLLVVFSLALRSARVPPELGVFFFAWGIGVSVWLWLKLERRSLTFCQVVAGLSCLELPYGTLLGVLTFVVAGRPSVGRLFQGGSTTAGDA